MAGDEHIALFRLDGALFFGAAERMLDRVSEIRDVDVVILRLSQLQLLDATGARVITEMIQALERRGSPCSSRASSRSTSARRPASG